MVLAFVAGAADNAVGSILSKYYIVFPAVNAGAFLDDIRSNTGISFSAASLINNIPKVHRLSCVYEGIKAAFKASAET